MDEVAKMFEDQQKRRAFADGRASRGTSATNPYVDPASKAAWDEGFNSTDN